MDDRRAYLMRRLFALLRERYVTARGDRLDGAVLMTKSHTRKGKERSRQP